eukprot:5160115-Pyramimonas_sp.AAC.1
MILSLDLKGAFYRVLLQFAFQLPRAPEELYDLLRDINIPEPSLPALQMAMEGAPIYHRSVGDEHLCARYKARAPT